MEANDKVYFEETQRFRQTWLMTLLFAINFINLYRIYMQVIKHAQLDVEMKHMSDAGLIRVAILMGIVTILVLTIKLDTVIRADGIYVRFFSFHQGYRHYSWSQMSRVYVRSYSPIPEYGGWGLRWMGKKKAYNVSGNIGLQIEFANKSTLLIGTQKPQELQAAIDRLNEG